MLEPQNQGNDKAGTSEENMKEKQGKESGFAARNEVGSSGVSARNHIGLFCKQPGEAKEIPGASEPYECGRIKRMQRILSCIKFSRFERKKRNAQL